MGAEHTHTAAVSLPPRASQPATRRSNQANASATPVWSLEGSAPSADNDATEPQDEAGSTPISAALLSKCDVHNVERTVCCRTLKSDDERNLIDPAVVKDIIIGLSDGFCVPFSLAAGLAAQFNSNVIVVAGIAEVISGSISMGVGGYLSAQAERDSYRFFKRKTRERVQRSCAGEMEREVFEVLGATGVDESLSRRVAGNLLKIEATLPDPSTPPSIWHQILVRIARKPKFAAGDSERTTLLPQHEDFDEKDERGLTSFLLKFGEGLEEVSEARLFISAFTIGASYFFGGLIPLIPYFFIESAITALYWSIGITSIVLLLFGGFKTYYTGAEVGIKGYTYGCLSMLAVGGSAAGAAFAIVKALPAGDP